jgi:hypothetical protein
MFAWTGSAWGSISSTADIYRFRYTAAGGETSESGPDDNGLTLSYIAGKEQVYLNGVLLVRTTDYNATNGSSITGLAALAAGDILEIITFTAFELADSIARSLFDAKGDILVATSADTPGKLTVGTNGHFLKADSSTATGLAWGVDTINGSLNGRGSLNTTEIILNNSNPSGNQSKNNGYAIIHLPRYAVTSGNQLMTAQYIGRYASGYSGGNFTATYAKSAAITSISLDAGNNTWTAGTVYIYGVN